MKLSLRDQLALIYTSAGSMRSVAALAGISHQKVSRILHSGEPGHISVSDRVLKDPGLIDAVQTAFSIHKQITREQAAVDQIPYSKDFPVYAERMLRSLTDTYVSKNGNKKAVPKIDPKTGDQVKVKGDRVEAANIHWLSSTNSDLLNRWILSVNTQRKFVNVSIGSIVNFKKYNKAAQRIADFQRRTGEVEETARNLMETFLGDAISQKKIDGMTTAQLAKAVDKYVEDEAIGRIQTRYTPMLGDAGGDPSPRAIIDDLQIKLREKHQPATGDPGTLFADRALFQIDTRHGKDDKFRKAHPIQKRQFKGPGAPKPAKARGNKHRTGRR